MAAPATGEWVIDARGVGRRFGAHRALKGVDLAVPRGEIFGVLGPDGAGKTTLMQILAAILDPSEGTCRVLGRDTVREADAVTARIGYMSQGFTLYDRLSVDENLAFAARIRSVPEAAFRVRRVRLLDMAGLARFGGRRAGALSGGMRKKLSLCTNLVHEPPLLLLDEPSLGVDPASRRELWRMLRGFRDGGATVVLTTPYMDEAEGCDRLGFLHGGRMLAVDTPGALRERCRGSVFEVESADAAAAVRILADAPAVAGVQAFADRLRFQLAPDAELPQPVRTSLARLGPVRAAEPDLENAFVHLSGAALGPMPEANRANVEGSGPGVDVAGVTVRFGDFTAVDDVSIRVAPGEILGLLGPNGAGKTTLIRVLCGLLRPAAGRVRVAGVDVTRDPMALRHRIGYMSQRFSLYPDLTVAENLAFFAGAYGLSGGRRREAAAEAVATTGLEGLEDRLAGELSGAQRQRLALACAVMHRPAVLFLDEPTSGVDPGQRQRFWQLIRLLAGAGMTVFVTTHYLEEARYCHRLGLMFRGRLIALGTIPELGAGVGLARPEAAMDDLFMAYVERERAAVGATP